MNLVPLPFLQFCTKHEYFKRNCTFTARENIQQMIDSELTPNARQNLSNYYVEEFNRLFADELRGDPGPAPKRRRVDSPERQPERLPDPDPDSDTSDIGEDDIPEEEPEPESQITIERVKSWYEKYAEMEISRFDRHNIPTKMSQISDILSAQSIVPSDRSTNDFQFPCDFINVQISPRIITLNLRINSRKEDDIRCCTQYWSHKEGCLFHTRRGLRLLKGVKYQHLAAKHFFTLVKHPANFFNTIQISTMPFEPHVHPATWPFRSFYGKVRKHLIKLEKRIDCVEFEMHLHKYMGRHEAGVKNLMSILPFLKPEELEKISISFWDDTEVFQLRNIPEPVDKFFYIREDSVPKEQWKAASELEFDDEQIRVADFGLVWSAKRVEFSMTHQDVDLLLESRANLPDGKSIEFVMNEDFDFDRAAEKGLITQDLDNGISLRVYWRRRIIRFSRRSK